MDELNIAAIMNGGVMQILAEREQNKRRLK